MEFLIGPLINAMIIVYSALGNSFLLAITVITIVVLMITLPLTLPQQRSAKKMQLLQPELQALQKKYAGNRQKLTEEQMKLYRENGVNPLGGCLPLILQLFIMIALYQAITGALALTPLQMLALSQRVAPDVAPLLPINSRFLWLDLGQPDPYFVLPALVFITTWAQQKVMSPATATGDANSAAMTRQMNIIMPVMFGFFALNFASGLSIYFIVSNLVRVVQYFFIGRRLTGGGGTGQASNKQLKAGNKAVAKK
jgi:YidC/Oxa1 family membrane protein insertase